MMIKANVILENSIWKKKIRNPKDYIKKSLRLLNQNGKLIIHTPNASSIMHQIFDQNWLGLDVSRHLIIFSYDGLITLMKSLGISNYNICTNYNITKFIFKASLLRMWNKNVYNDSNPFITIISFLILPLVKFINLNAKNRGDEIVLTINNR